MIAWDQIIPDTAARILIHIEIPGYKGNDSSFRHGIPRIYSKVQDCILDLNSISVNGMVGDLLGMKERPDSSALLNEIQIPTLILHGVDDTLIPVAEAESMEAALPNGRLRVLPEAGHLLNLEQPILFNQEIGRFLTNF